MSGKREQKPKGRFMKIIVISTLLYLIIYTAVSIWLGAKIGLELGTLTQWNFTVFGMELLVMGIKKILGDKGGTSNGSEL